MVTEYPHTIITNGTELVIEPYQDVNGDWVLPTDGEVVMISQPGRAEVNTKGAKVPSQNGVKIDYSYMIYFPFDAKDILYGQNLIIKDENGVQIGQGTVISFFRGSLNAWAWV